MSTFSKPKRWEKEQPPRALGPSWRALAGIVVFATLLRVPGMISIPLWMDEHYTLDLLDAGWTHILHTGQTVHPPGYALLAYPFRAAGEADWALRVPALLGSLCGILVAFSGARVVGQQKVAHWAALLVAASFYHVYYSQEARGYSWLACTGAIACFAACEHLARPRVLSLSLCLAASLAAIGFHYMAAPSIAGLWVLLILVPAVRFLRNRRETGSRRYEPGVLVCWVLASLVLACGVVLLRERIDTVQRVLSARSSTRIAFDGQFLMDALGRWSGLGAARGPFLVPLFLLGIWRLFRQSIPQAMAIIVSIVAPLVVVASVAWPHRFELRYLMSSQIPVLLVLSTGSAVLFDSLATRLGKLGRDRTSTAGFTLILLLQLWPTSRHVLTPRKYTPAVNTNTFGYQYLVQNSLLEPRLVRDLRTDDFATSLREVGPHPIPLPTWPIEHREVKGTTIEVRLKNPFADDALTVLVTPSRKRHGERATISTKRETRPGGGPIGLSRLVANLPDRGIRIELQVRSSRLRLVDQYFRVVVRDLGN